MGRRRSRITRGLARLERYRDTRRLIIANTMVITEPDSRKIRELLIVLAAIGVLLVPFLVYVWQGIEVMRAGYRIEELKTTRSELIEENRRLEIEKARLRSVGRIEKLAMEKLGLKYPEPGQIVYVAVEQETTAGTDTPPEDRP